MFLKRIQTLHFKNLKNRELVFSPKLNCFVGHNGVGKTNLLDAIHYLSFGKSYFSINDQQNIRFEENFFLIEGNFEKNGHDETVSCALKKGEKKILKKDRKIYTRMADHVGQYPLVIVSPYDCDMITEGSEIRRKLIDNIISQSDKDYLYTLIQYQKNLLQRNALLKNEARYNSIPDKETLDIYDLQMDTLGQKIYEKRKKFLTDFEPVFQEHYKKIARMEETADLIYNSPLDNTRLYELLISNRAKDRSLQYTSTGIHKDDLEFRIQGRSVKRFGSQGQKKSFLIALKLAQFDFIKKQSEINPLLLLDDVFDKLDEQRVDRLIQLVNKSHFGQIFISDTHPESIKTIVNRMEGEHQIFHLKS